MANDLVAAALLAALVGAAAAHAAEPPKTSFGDRLYAGIAAASLRFSDEYDSMRLTDSSATIGLYAGFLLKERLALEISYDSYDAIELHDIAGSGIARLDVESERRTIAVSVLREVSLKEIFEWRRDWRVYGAMGIYESEVDRTVTFLGSGAAASAIVDATGLFLGAGVLYAIGRVELRGYVRSFGAVLDDGKAREMGAAVQLRF